MKKSINEISDDVVDEAAEVVVVTELHSKEERSMFFSVTTKGEGDEYEDDDDDKNNEIAFTSVFVDDDFEKFLTNPKNCGSFWYEEHGDDGDDDVTLHAVTKSLETASR